MDEPYPLPRSPLPGDEEWQELCHAFQPAKSQANAAVALVRKMCKEHGLHAVKLAVAETLLANALGKIDGWDHGLRYFVKVVRNAPPPTPQRQQREMTEEEVLIWSSFDRTDESRPEVFNARAPA